RRSWRSTGSGCCLQSSRHTECAVSSYTGAATAHGGGLLLCNLLHRDRHRPLPAHPQIVCRWLTHFPRKPEQQHCPDNAPADVELPPAQPVPRRRRKRVVVVVPPFTQRVNANEEVVAALVSGGVRL